MVTTSIGTLFKVRSGDGIAVASLSSYGKYPVYGGNGIAGFTNRYNTESGTMIIGRVGEKCGNVNVSESRCWVSDNALKVTPLVEYNQNYMMYLMEHTNINSYANRNAQPVVSGQIIYAIEVPYCTDIKEQGVIASTLTEFDSHIANLAELIEKKKAIRDGGLDDLMSGRTRLAGFESPWITLPFGEYFTLRKNNTYAREMLSERGTVGNIHYGDILIKYNVVVENRDDIPRLRGGVPYSDNWLLQEKDIVIADTAEDETVGRAIQIGKVSIPLVGGLHTIVCRPNYETASGFLGYYINSKAFHDQLLPHITGIKVSSISKKVIKTMEVHIPSDENEQNAIVSVLKAMDDEIKAIEDERDKMIQIREGVMDDLFTGRIRLKI